VSDYKLKVIIVVLMALAGMIVMLFTDTSFQQVYDFVHKAWTDFIK
jgi:hypothetical protein